MGIVFGKQRDNVQVLTIKTTQSLPAIRTERKFGKNSDLGQKTRSTSYQTTLPGLPNLISSDEEEERVQVPPPFTLPPLSQRLAIVGDHNTNSSTIINTNITATNPESTPKVVDELSSSSDQYSSCVEDLGTHLQRETTVVMREILGNRLEELRRERRDVKPLSSRESLKLLSSRDSYRKTCLRSRKRARKNSCLSEESSLTMSHVWSREEDTLSPSGDETVSDVRALIRDTPVRRTYAGCRISRKSTLDSGLRFNSSSDEALPEFAIRYHLSKRDRRTRRDRIEGRVQLASSVTESVEPNTRTMSGARVSSAWHGQPSRTQSKQQLLLIKEDSYDASSELSSSDSEDDLNYSNRFNTNPFLKLRSSSYFARQRSLAGIHQMNQLNRPGSLKPLPGRPQNKKTARPDIINILPDYAKSSYNPPTSSHNPLMSSHNLPTSSHNNPREPNIPDTELAVSRRTRTAAARQKALHAPKITTPASNEASSSSAKSMRETDLSPRAQFMIYKPPDVEPDKPRKQNDEFDDLDSAVEMFKLLF